MTGWVAWAPTGHHEALLLLTTPSPTATDMTAVAAGLGLVSGTMTTTDRAHVEVAATGRATLVTDRDRIVYLTASPSWRAVALERAQVVLVVGVDPMPTGMTPAAYLQQAGASCILGVAPCWAV